MAKQTGKPSKRSSKKDTALSESERDKLLRKMIGPEIHDKKDRVFPMDESMRKAFYEFRMMSGLIKDGIESMRQQIRDDENELVRLAEEYWSFMERKTGGKRYRIYINQQTMEITIFDT